MLFITLPAQASDTGWNYTVAPGDTLSHIAKNYLNHPDDWRQLQLINKINDPALLAPGTVLYIPYAISGGMTFAEVIWVRGDAQRINNAVSTVITHGMQIGMGETISTGEGSSLTLRFMDRSRMLVSSNSRITLNKIILNKKSGQISTTLSLEAGAVESVVTPTESVKAQYEIKAPALSLAVRGTRFRVKVDSRTGLTHTMVSQGEVAASAQNLTVSVTAGHGTLATPGSPPETPRALLNPPAITSALSVFEQLPVQFSWNHLEGAKQYRVELLDRGGLQQIGEMMTTDTLTGWKNLEDGDYQLRVSGIDDVGLEGKAAISTFTLNARPEPPLLLQPHENSNLTEGKVVFRWTRVVDRTYHRVQVSDSPNFSKLIAQIKQLPGNIANLDLRLAPGRYYWRIAGATRENVPGPYSTVQHFDVKTGMDTLPASEDDAFLAWNSGSSGQKYHIQVARDPDFTAPLLDSSLTVPHVQFKVTESGTYYVRLRRIEANGLSGIFEPTQQFTLSKNL